jgi:hypothetical protein
MDNRTTTGGQVLLLNPDKVSESQGIGLGVGRQSLGLVTAAASAVRRLTKHLSEMDYLENFPQTTSKPHLRAPKLTI